MDAARVLTHWHWTGLRSSCARPPRRNRQAITDFLIDKVSAEGERIRFGPRIQKLDFEQMVTNR